MKTIVIILLSLFATIESEAQVPSFIAPQIKYDTCNNLQQFEGEWTYTDGTKTIKIFFRQHRFAFHGTQFLNDTKVMDWLVGFYEYTDAGNVVVSDYQFRNDTLPYNEEDLHSAPYSPIFLRADKCDSTNRFEGYLTDYNYSNQTKRVVALLDPTKTIMTWYQYNKENGYLNQVAGMTLPASFVLVKQ